jgi:hypothetical protein
VHGLASILHESFVVPENSGFSVTCPMTSWKTDEVTQNPVLRGLDVSDKSTFRQCANFPSCRPTAQSSIRGVVSVLEVPQIHHIANMTGTTITDMNVTKSRATCRVVLILLSTVAMIAGAQSSTQDQSSAQETLARGYWSDSSTGLVWAANDNGKDVTWDNALKYCRNLSLAGYSDWRLPSIDELQGIYDDSGFTAPHPKDVVPVLAGKAKGGLLLTGAREWSSSRVLDDRGHSTGYAWEYDFPHGRRDRSPRLHRQPTCAVCAQFQ